MKSNNGYLALRTQPQYLKIIAANLVGRFGDSIDAIAFSWLMYEVTGSASLMALNLALNFLPTVLLQPVAGVLVDRLPKRLLMVVCDLGRGIVVASVALTVVFGRTTALLLMAMTLLNSTFESLQMPANIAVLPHLLDEDHRTAGMALNSSLCRVSELVGTALAGSIIALLGSGGALLIDAITFFLSSILIFWIRIDEPRDSKSVNFAETKRSFLEGLRYVRGNPLLIGILFLGMLMNGLFAPISAFSAVYVADFLLAGPQFLSFTQLALVGGMALGSLLVPKLTASRKMLFVLAGFLSSLSLMAMLIFPTINTFILRQVLMLANVSLLGLSIGVQNVIFSTTLVKHVDQSFLGRVGGITNSVLCSAIPILSLICSGLAVIAPVPTVIFVSGVLGLILYFAVLRIPVYNDL